MGLFAFFLPVCSSGNVRRIKNWELLLASSLGETFNNLVSVVHLHIECLESSPPRIPVTLESLSHLPSPHPPPQSNLLHSSTPPVCMLKSPSISSTYIGVDVATTSHLCKVANTWKVPSCSSFCCHQVVKNHMHIN